MAAGSQAAGRKNHFMNHVTRPGNMAGSVPQPSRRCQRTTAPAGGSVSAIAEGPPPATLARLVPAAILVLVDAIARAILVTTVIVALTLTLTFGFGWRRHGRHPDPGSATVTVHIAVSVALLVFLLILLAVLLSSSLRVSLRFCTSSARCRPGASLSTRPWPPPVPPPGDAANAAVEARLAASNADIRLVRLAFMVFTFLAFVVDLNIASRPELNRS
jgi:hypothetical protein